MTIRDTMPNHPPPGTDHVPGSELRGVYSALFTPFDSHGQVNHRVLEQLVDFQLRRGLSGFFVTGTTGEGMLLSESERESVVRRVVECCYGRATVIAHVGHPATEVACRLARQAAAAGADWIASTGPVWYGQSFAGACRHYRMIAAASDRPFMIYSIGSRIEPERDRRLFDIPGVAGLKYTGTDYFAVQQLARLLDRPVALMNGCDEQLVAALSFGFHGGIGSTYNFAPEFYAGIVARYREGDIEAASRLQRKINQVTSLMLEYENWSYRKAIMKYVGLDCGSYRPPYEPISEAEYRQFARRLDELGVLERADA